LRKLEEQYPDAIAVVGVHSGKYTTERRPERIRDASIRLGVAHAVVNDRQFRVWRGYAVNAWPTIVAVDPRGYVVGQHAGEFMIEEIAPFLDRTLAEAERGGVLVRSVDHAAADPPTVLPGALRFPGKVATDGVGRLAIADSGHHRVVIGRLADGGRRLRIERVVGSEPAYADGDAREARFHYPQGLAFRGDELLVADTFNHAVRAVSLATGHVRTIAGTGRQLRTSADLRAGALASPWDLTVAGDRVFIAMAGSHQIWSVGPTGGDLRVHAGTRQEDIADGPLAEAALAQPMGIAAGDGDSRLYFVDAESSAVRWADTDTAGSVGTLVGTGLFDFGDRDGTGDHVLMQHQQGIAVARDGRLLVADSYNDALKWVDPSTRAATTWVRGLHEPGGLALAESLVYVADTNAHRIAVVDRASGQMGTLEIEDGPRA
jgi:sugar lactone lactonase YvrE